VKSVLADHRSHAPQAIGEHAADHLGAVLGSLTAWVLLSRHTGVREIIGWSAVPGIVAVLLLVFVLRGVNGRRSSVDRTAPPRPPADAPESHARIDVTGRAFWLPVGTLVFLTVGRLPETLMLLRLQDLGLSIALIPLLWAALHVVRSAASYPGGWLSDHLGARFGMALGSLLYAGVAVALAAAGGRAWAVAVFLLHGVVAGLVEPAERVAVTKLAPVRTGRGFGDYQGLAGLAALPMGLAFGLIYRNFGGPAALLASAACMGIATALWLGTVPTARVR
jgi:hypothetical protein